MKADKGLIWPFIIILLVAFLIWTEDGSQNCLNKKCNNSCPEINKQDKPTHMIDKIIENVRLNHTEVIWRRSLLVAIFASLLIFVLFYRKGFPHGIKMFLLIVIIFLGVYFSTSWLQLKWWKANNSKIESSLYRLRANI